MKQAPLLPVLLASGLSITALGARPASGAVIFWTGGDTGNFQSAFNWNGPVPGPQDNAIFVDFFANSLDITVGFTGSATTLGLDIGQLAVTLDLAQHTYTVTGALTMIDAELTLNNGTLSAAVMTLATDSVLSISDNAVLLNSSAVIGGAAASAGTVNVAGSWINNGNIILGNSGIGTLNISHDGMDSTGSGGLVETGSLVLGAASGGLGTVNIGENGVLNTSAATIGGGVDSFGVISVGDGGVWRNSGGISIGASGSVGGGGAINVEGGGLLRTLSLNVGNNAVVSQIGTGAIVLADIGIDFSSLNATIQSQINAGGLFIADNGLTITNGGVVQATRAFIDGFTAGARAEATVSGNGSLLDLDGGELTIGGRRNGFLTVSGGGRVESGDVVVGNSANGIGTATVTGQSSGGNASQLNADGSLVVGNNGSGSLTVSGGGAVNVSGSGAVATTEGGTGTVSVTGTSAGGDASTLDIGGSLTLGLAPAGPGAVASGAVQAGLSVTNGGVVVLGGGAETLNITGSGLLSGNGVIDGSVLLSGWMRPGAVLGGLTVTGDLQTTEGSIIDVRYSDQPADLAELFPSLDPALAEDLLSSGFVVVEGAVTLADGSIIRVVKLSGGTNPGDAIIVLHSTTGGIDPGDLANLDLQGSFLVNWTPDLIEDGGESYLRLTAEIDEPGLDDFLTGLTGNLRRVADALVGGDLFEVLTQLDPDAPESGLSTLLPLQHATATAQNIRTSQQFHHSFMQEMAGRRAAARGSAISGRPAARMLSGTEDSSSVDLFGSAPRLGEQASQPRMALGAIDEDITGTWGGFLTGFGNWQSIDSGDDRPGYRARMLGIQLGAHRQMTRDIIVGLSGGYAQSELTFRDGTDEGEIDSFRLGPYLSWTPQDHNFFVNASVSYAAHRNEMERTTILGTARSKYRANDLSAVAQAGYDFEVSERTTLTPQIAAEYLSLRTKGFRESGAGAADLDVAARTDNSLRLHLGGSVAHVFESGNLTIIPELYAGWAREMLDADVDLRSRFVAGGPSFTTSAAGVDRDALRISAGFTAMSGTYITLFMRYEGEFQSSRDSHGFIGGLGISF